MEETKYYVDLPNKDVIDANVYAKCVIMLRMREIRKMIDGLITSKEGKETAFKAATTLQNVLIGAVDVKYPPNKTESK